MPRRGMWAEVKLAGLAVDDAQPRVLPCFIADVQQDVEAERDTQDGASFPDSAEKGLDQLPVSEDSDRAGEGSSRGDDELLSPIERLD